MTKSWTAIKSCQLPQSIPEKSNSWNLQCTCHSSEPPVQSPIGSRSHTSTCRSILTSTPTNPEEYSTYDFKPENLLRPQESLPRALTTINIFMVIQIMNFFRFTCGLLILNVLDHRLLLISDLTSK